MQTVTRVLIREGDAFDLEVEGAAPAECCSRRAGHSHRGDRAERE